MVIIMWERIAMQIPMQNLFQIEKGLIWTPIILASSPGSPQSWGWGYNNTNGHRSKMLPIKIFGPPYNVQSVDKETVKDQWLGRLKRFAINMLFLCCWFSSACSLLVLLILILVWLHESSPGSWVCTIFRATRALVAAFARTQYKAYGILVWAKGTQLACLRSQQWSLQP